MVSESLGGHGHADLNMISQDSRAWLRLCRKQLALRKVCDEHGDAIVVSACPRRRSARPTGHADLLSSRWRVVTGSTTRALSRTGCVQWRRRACLVERRRDVRPKSRSLASFAIADSHIASATRAAIVQYVDLPRSVHCPVAGATAFAAHCSASAGGDRLRANLPRRTRYWLRRELPHPHLDLAIARVRIVPGAFPYSVGVLRVWRLACEGEGSCRWGCCAVGGGGPSALPCLSRIVARDSGDATSASAGTGDMRIVLNLHPLDAPVALNGAIWVYLHTRIFDAAPHALRGRLGTRVELMRSVRTVARGFVARLPVARNHGVGGPLGPGRPPTLGARRRRPTRAVVVAVQFAPPHAGS